MVSSVDLFERSTRRNIGHFVDRSVTRYDACVCSDSVVVLESGGHEEMHLLSVRPFQQTLIRAGPFASPIIAKDFQFIMSISGTLPYRRVEMYNPRVGEVVHSIPLSVASLRTTSFLEDLAKETIVWPRAKVYVLGEENVGKTHIVRMLRGEKSKENISTDGVALEDIEMDDVQLRVMDFGGQEVRSCVHRSTGLTA